MKLTIVFMVTAFMQVSFAGYGQKITLSEKNTSLERVLLQIRSQTGYNILCDAGLLKEAKPVSIQLKNADIKEAIEKSLAGQPFTYLIKRNTVVIKKNPVVENILSKEETPPLTVTGKVLDEKGEPLPGVSILLQNTKIGTSTNINGEYTLNIPEENAGGNLIFSFIGYQKLEIPIKGQTRIDATLKPDQEAMSEVVVVGYGTQQKRDVTGSIASVSAAQIENMPVTGLDQALSGQLAGVQVQQTSGEPGGNINVRIRGSGSIGAGNAPLYVVDGYPGITDLNSIDPNDIESIDVLKDASAAAIYGSRGANGVVIVTTKRGRAGKTTFNVNAYSGVQQVINKVDVMNAQEYTDHAVLARNNGYADVGGNIDLRQVKNSQRPGAHRIHAFLR